MTTAIARRAFLTTLGGAAAAALAEPKPVRAQQGGLRKVAVLIYYVEGDPECKDRLATLIE